MTQGDFGDAKVGAVVFSLPAPGFTEIVATPFGFVVSRVAKIQPAVFSKTFEQAEAELRAELATRKAAPTVRGQHDAIEDQPAPARRSRRPARRLGGGARHRSR